MKKIALQENIFNVLRENVAVEIWPHLDSDDPARDDDGAIRGSGRDAAFNLVQCLDLGIHAMHHVIRHDACILGGG
jgi:hypothetical protein